VSLFRVGGKELWIDKIEVIFEGPEVYFFANINSSYLYSLFEIEEMMIEVDLIFCG
jgi:hypothetical protein